MDQDLAPFKVLIADDDRVMRMKLERFLTHDMGAEVIVADSGTQAWELCNTHDVRLVISDWLMPGIKGDEFLIQVRERYPNIKSILITGQADDSAIDRALQEGGACAVIRKPWSTEELVREVRSCCMSDGGVCHD